MEQKTNFVIALKLNRLVTIRITSKTAKRHVIAVEAGDEAFYLSHPNNLYSEHMTLCGFDTEVTSSGSTETSFSLSATVTCKKCSQIIEKYGLITEIN